jgi:hypothetical protein
VRSGGPGVDAQTIDFLSCVVKFDYRHRLTILLGDVIWICQTSYQEVVTNIDCDRKLRLEIVAIEANLIW